MKNYAVGVDIGGTTVKMGLFASAGELLDKWEIATRKENGGKFILGDIAESILQKLKDKNISVDDLEGVGMGVPGPILSNGIVNKCVNLGWGVFPVEEELKKALKISNVKAGNDANVAALGEMWQGGGKGYENMVMVTLGTGVGGGIILGGRIVPGSFGAGGEIGHIQVSDKETEFCGCGKKGCLEQYASATGIVRKARQLLEETDVPSMLRNLQEITAKEIFDVAKQGDSLALEILEFVGENLGRALSYISCVVDPQAYVIGGGVSKAGNILLEVIQKYYGQTAFHASRAAAFKLAQLGNDAGIYGAVRMILS